jgi:large subunit ribosomal protein L18
LKSHDEQQCLQEATKKVEEAIKELCLEKGISKMAFDKGGFVYHKRVKMLADAAHEGGLEF